MKEAGVLLQISYLDGTDTFRTVHQLKVNARDQWLHYLEDESWVEIEEDWEEIKAIYVNNRPVYLRPSDRSAYGPYQGGRRM